MVAFLKFVFLKVQILMLVIYVLSPIDLIPEFIFGIFGLIDDLLVILAIVILLSRQYYNQHNI